MVFLFLNGFDVQCTWLFDKYMFDKYMVCIVVWLCCVILWGLYCGGTFEGQATATLLLANVSTHVFSLKSMEDITLYKYKATYIIWHDHVIRIGMKCRLCLKYQHSPNHRRLEKWGMINRCEVMCLLCALSPLSQMTNFPPQHHSSFQDTAKLTIIILDHPQKIYTWGHSRPITIIPILLGINPKSSTTHRLIDLLYTYKKI